MVVGPDWDPLGLSSYESMMKEPLKRTQLIGSLGTTQLIGSLGTFALLFVRGPGGGGDGERT